MFTKEQAEKLLPTVSSVPCFLRHVVYTINPGNTLLTFLKQLKDYYVLRKQKILKSIIYTLNSQHSPNLELVHSALHKDY